MNKCDIVIPVYKSPEWVKLCVYSLFVNTDIDLINKVYLVNDCDDELTINCLNNLKRKYNKIEVLFNEENLGFIKTSNKGIKTSTAEYVLLLNTDCIISKNTISKMINHCKNNRNIGLICPISSNAANLTLDMYKGFSFSDMNSLLEEKFLGQCFDACTVVGNCLMITRECINRVGLLDEIYGTGYGEETDYQFKAMEAGFEAKVAIDTYVFHKSEVSFGTSKEKQEKQQKNASIFFERWGEKYYSLLEEYKKNNPIEYINKNISIEDKRNHFKFLVYIIGFSQTAGGIHVVTDMINYLSINNYKCNIVYSFENEKEYNEILLFNPINITDIDNFKFDKIMSTFYTTTYYMKYISNKYSIPLIYFAQGYESYFYNGKEYGIAELSYKLSDEVLTVSNYLSQKYFDSYNVDSNVISNGINHDLLFKNNESRKPKSITFMLRNDVLKGDFLLLDVIKLLINKIDNIEINIMYNSEKIIFPKNDNEKVNINMFKGPFSRKDIASILQKSDIFVDASLTEGFGLMALEAMAAGNVVVVANSGGINEYLKDGINGFVINDVLNINNYIDKIENLINDEKLYKKIKNESKKTAIKFDYDNVVKKYIAFFEKKLDKKDKELDTVDNKLYNDVLNNKFRLFDETQEKEKTIKSVTKKSIYKISRIMPKKMKRQIKKIIIKTYNLVKEDTND